MTYQHPQAPDYERFNVRPADSKPRIPQDASRQELIQAKLTFMRRLRELRSEISSFAFEGAPPWSAWRRWVDSHRRSLTKQIRALEDAIKTIELIAPPPKVWKPNPKAKLPARVLAHYARLEKTQGWYHTLDSSSENGEMTTAE